MNIRDSHKIAVLVSGMVFAVFTGGCAVNSGAPQALTSVAPANFSQLAVRPGHVNQKLYISNIDGSVLVYSVSTEQQVQTITDGVSRPGGVWVDKRGVFYAVNLPDQYYQTSLPEYKPNAQTPFRTITDGIVNCGDVAVDGKLNVYVTGVDTANGEPFVEIYPKNELSPAETLTIPTQGLSGVEGLAFDSTGALLIGEIIDEGNGGAVYRLPAGSQTFTSLHLQKAPGGAIAVDQAGNLYVGGGNNVVVYTPGSRKPSRKIYVSNGVVALAVEPNGELYVGTREGISVYEPGSKEAKTTFNVEALIGGIALSPE